jgi:hypothetical protein
VRLGPVARPLVLAALALCVLTLVMSARAVLEARAESARADVALAAGDADTAIVRLRTTARWYAPFNVYASNALTRLQRLAELSEARGEHARALTAYRAIHAAIHATRSFYTPHRELLASADEHIATLMAAEPPAPIEQQQSPAQRKADYLALLRPSQPRLIGVLLAIGGLVTWVGSAVAFLTWGVDGEGRALRRIGRRSIGLLLVGWIMFAVGLRIA